MEESNAATTSAWDWGEQRLTVGRHFIRDMEGLWSEVLKLAVVCVNVDAVDSGVAAVLSVDI